MLRKASGKEARLECSPMTRQTGLFKKRWECPMVEH
jgi:hypothetical protein